MPFMERLRDALQVVNSMKDEGVIEDYAGGAKRRERAAMLLDWSGLNRKLLDEILNRHGLSL
jgi:hypothetical protein